jgi:hypothetical protein
VGVPVKYGAELEVAANAGFICASHSLIEAFSMRTEWRLIPTAGTDGTAAAYTTAVALLVFVVGGGTFIVRAVLNRAGDMPPADATPPTALATQVTPRPEPQVNAVELNHGRLIGNVERLILVLFVAQDQFTALAFFFAAKGLIRSKDVERRAWADYLILGSLTSFLVAVVVGLLIRSLLFAPPP